MRISGLGVIADAVLELDPGLTVVTGETGAGKTMVVHGLALLFGGRLDSALVRTGAARALVEGRLLVRPDAEAAVRAAEAGAELDEGALLLSRTMTAEGRSRAHLGGRSVPVSVLADVATSSVALHGQGDQLRLLRPPEQRAALDRYAGSPVGDLLGRHRALHDRWTAVGAELEEITARRRERVQEADLLRLGLTEIATTAPQPGEDTALASEVARLGHADALRSGATSAHELLAGDPDRDGADAGSLVGAARQALAPVAGHDAELDDLARRLSEASYLLADVSADLASYVSRLDADPGRLQDAQERQAALARLTRKYASDLEGVLAWAAGARTRLAELDGDDDRVAELAAEHRAAAAELADVAAALSSARQGAGRAFGAAVTAELADLAMADAVVSVAVTQEDVATGGLEVAARRLAISRDGVDEVALLLAAHPGAPARPVARAASGGELSRVMLAIEVVFAAADPVPTLVFDEVDAGVGGSAAVEVGRRLALLARSHQVVVVTHLPQVAAFADRHLHVAKSSDGTVTSSGVTRLDDDGRRRELSRMLAGLEGSDLALGHADELLDVAASAKAAG